MSKALESMLEEMTRSLTDREAKYKTDLDALHTEYELKSGEERRTIAGLRIALGLDSMPRPVVVVKQRNPFTKPSAKGLYDAVREAAKSIDGDFSADQLSLPQYTKNQVATALYQMALKGTEFVLAAKGDRQGKKTLYRKGGA